MLYIYFPTLTCGVFVFSSVSAPPPSRPPPSLIHSLTHSLTHSPTHSLTHSLPHSLTHSVRCFCVAGVGQCALPRGRMYALASLGVPLVSLGLRFCVEAWDNVHCQGVGCTVSLGLRCFCVAGVTMRTAKGSEQVWDNVHCQGVGRVYALASLWRLCGVPWAPLLLRGRRGTMCTAQMRQRGPGRRKSQRLQSGPK